MSVKPTIESVLVKAFDFNSALKRTNRSEIEVSQLRNLVKNEKWISQCVTDKHVRQRLDLLKLFVITLNVECLQLRGLLKIKKLVN